MSLKNKLAKKKLLSQEKKARRRGEVFYSTGVHRDTQVFYKFKPDYL